MPRVVVLGGGITGLTAALTLVEEHPDIDVTLLEASERLGGKLHTTDVDGIQIEAGADSFLARRPEAVDLCRKLGLSDVLAPPAVFGGLTYVNGRLRRIPSGTVMGVPASTSAILSNSALSPAGKLRALGDLVMPGRLSGHDTSIGALIERRFGTQTLERLVDPLLAGTRAGRPHEISLRAALPELDRAARSHSSVIRGLQEVVGASGTGPPPFLAPRTGMSGIVDAIRDRLEPAMLKLSTAAERISPARRGFAIATNGDEKLDAHGVVVALPAHHAANVLSSLSEDVARGLGRIRHASVAVVTLIYEAGALRFPKDSSGFLVPSTASLSLSAATWWSVKWPHTVPDDRIVVRAFIGRAGGEAVLHRDDGSLIVTAGEEVGSILRTNARPVGGEVTRWDDGLPVYDVGHWGRVSRIEGALEPHHTVVLAGADYRGSGILDCIRQGASAARRVAAAL